MMPSLNERDIRRIKRREDAIDAILDNAGWAVAAWIAIGTIALAVAVHLLGGK